MTQPEALRLAEYHECASDLYSIQTAAELRRLHEVEKLYHTAIRGLHAMSDEVLKLTAQRDALLKALRNYVDGCSLSVDALAVARAAIAAVEQGEAK